MNIYVASSWRNDAHPAMILALRAWGHDVYDFRNPTPGDNGFSWREIDGDWLRCPPKKFREMLTHPAAQHGFALDMGALRTCDACVLLLPCGRSAHLELGWAVGAGKRTCVLAAELPEPELMYKMVDLIALSLNEVLAWVGRV